MSPLPPDPNASDRGSRRDGGERRLRVLLADDDEHVRQLGARILAREGWEVVAAADGREAVDAWPSGGRPFDLVILDVVMPEMDGYEAYRTLLRRHPQARFLFISGFAEDERWRRLVEDEGHPFLPKPYAPQDLVALIRTLLS